MAETAQYRKEKRDARDNIAKAYVRRAEARSGMTLGNKSDREKFDQAVSDIRNESALRRDTQDTNASDKKSKDAGVPAGQDYNSKEYGTDSASSGRSMLEQQNNALADGYAKAYSETDTNKRKALVEQLKKQAEEIKKNKGK